MKKNLKGSDSGGERWIKGGGFSKTGRSRKNYPTKVGGMRSLAKKMNTKKKK